MTYSVFRPELHLYDYYEDGKATAAFPNPKHISGRVASDRAGWPLPAGARKTGTGPTPKGQIARVGLGGDDVTSSIWSIVGLGLLAYGLLRATRG
jgi:hypothetical protein